MGDVSLDLKFSQAPIWFDDPHSLFQDSRTAVLPMTSGVHYIWLTNACFGRKHGSRHL